MAAGTKKAGMAPEKILALGVLSGAHIGFGALLMLVRPAPQAPEP